MISRLVINHSGPLSGTARVPGDKSISHRALILGLLADGENRVRGWLDAGDTRATLEAARALGADVRQDGDTLVFRGACLQAPSEAINCRNAGTAMRLLAGLLVGQPFTSILNGSPQLRRRPMGRITAPLCQMGADIEDTGGRAPLRIRPASLRAVQYRLPVASAQVKSALILAALHARGRTEIVEPGPARDHTERMLRAMGADLEVDGPVIRVAGGRPLQPLRMQIPGDISSAAFLIVAALLLPDSAVTIEDVGLNSTRTGLLSVLRRMGAAIEADSRLESGEEIGELTAMASAMEGLEVGGDVIVRAIDELPILAVAATQAEGKTVIRDAGELRVKEVDRIALLATELRRFGAELVERPDGMVIHGPTRLHGAEVHSHGDHRLGMALAVAGLAATGTTVVHGVACIEDSFPGFAETMIGLGAGIEPVVE